MPGPLSDAQIEAFWETGCLTVADAVEAAVLAAINADLAGWIEESRGHDKPYGTLMDGRARFDLQPGHTADRPALRRVQSPTELSAACLTALTASPMIRMAAQLIGPDLRFHHSKVNCKLPGSATQVDWHQDFLFDPHSNDDVVTCLLFLGDVGLRDGPLMTVPGSHRGPLYSHWQNGKFTGRVAPDIVPECEARAVPQTGPAGSACFMHGRSLHASRANLGDRPRNLFIAEIAAADAVPLSPNPVPSVHAGMILYGQDTGRIRSTPFEMDGPIIPETTFFDQQVG
ncbi:phytanoyl-CoA dioxygenase family protein [Hwanghaeella sp.]|uniref:phytanoyl-CoA dioxygenase family protein n=1 Tax=Hwanghaeella sp. TaxID=2605943 RepID=UPI003CCBD660